MKNLSNFDINVLELMIFDDISDFLIDDEIDHSKDIETLIDLFRKLEVFKKGE